MASTYLSWTPSNTETSPYKRTISVWCKRANVSNEMVIISARPTQRQFFRFETTGELRTLESGGSNWAFITNAKYRDTNGWYHVVFAYDSTQATSTDRMKLYVNGEQVTSFSSITYPPLNETIDIGRSGYPIHIGNDSEQTTPYFDGIMSHFHLIDGTAYDASTFGETDSTSGVWKPKTQPSVTYGTNGFFLKFANSASLGTDSSGNGNNLTLSGSGTQTLDTPSNVYATLNPLHPTASASFSNGNNTITGSNATAYTNNSQATLGVSAGKWYWETEFDSAGANTNATIGVISMDAPANINPQEGDVVYNPVSLRMDNTLFAVTGGAAGTSNYLGSTPTAGDIIQIALDMDNGKVWFGLNGTFVGDPAAGTGAAYSSITSGLTMTHCIRPVGSVLKTNFGNGYFGTTVISSPNSDGAGEGKFAYAPPTGYYALNTRNIKTYG